MLVLLQRVKFAEVVVNQEKIAQIQIGLLAFCAFLPDDTHEKIEKMLHKIINYRLFSDKADKMNLSLQEIKGELLLAPQFTLAANTKSGLRPSFSTAAPPEKGQEFFKFLCQTANSLPVKTAFGQFGADMQISLCNNGPVTFMLKN